jgi:hypothetical protein
MEAVLARVMEVLVADVVDAVRAHESYKQLVDGAAESTLAALAGKQGPTSGS